MTSHEHNSSSAITLRILSLVMSPKAEKKISISRRFLVPSLTLDFSWVMRFIGVKLESTRPRLTRRLTLAWATVVLKLVNNGNTY
jgi:hypothetical protein